MTVSPEPPDFTGYVDPNLWPYAPQEVIEQVLADAAIDWPAWQPNELQSEFMLIKAVTVIADLLGRAVNRAPAVALEGLLMLAGVARDPGLRPTATVTITVNVSTGVTVPAGTELRLDLTPGLPSVAFLTDDDLVIPNTQTTGTVAMTGQSETSDANGTPAGTALTVVTGAMVDAAVLATEIAGGRASEDSAGYRERGSARLARLTEVLVTPFQYRRAAEENPAVVRAVVADEFDSSLGSGVPGDHPGHISVAVAGSGGTALTTPQKDELEDFLNDPERVAAGIVAHVHDPDVTTVDVTATVRRLRDADPADAQAAATAAVLEYLNPDTFEDPDNTVRRFELASFLDGAAGVAHVVSITSPAADVALTGALPLAKAGTVTITVVS